MSDKSMPNTYVQTQLAGIYIEQRDSRESSDNPICISVRRLGLRNLDEPLTYAQNSPREAMKYLASWRNSDALEFGPERQAPGYFLHAMLLPRSTLQAALESARSADMIDELGVASAIARRDTGSQWIAHILYCPNSMQITPTGGVSLRRGLIAPLSARKHQVVFKTALGLFGDPQIRESIYKTPDMTEEWLAAGIDCKLMGT